MRLLLLLLILPLIAPKLLLLIEHSRHGATSQDQITPEGLTQHFLLGKELKKDVWRVSLFYQKMSPQNTK